MECARLPAAVNMSARGHTLENEPPQQADFAILKPSTPDARRHGSTAAPLTPRTEGAGGGGRRAPLAVMEPAVATVAAAALSPTTAATDASSSSRLFDVRVMGVESSGGAARWYNVRLVCRLRPELSWRVTRRYRDFDALMTALQADSAAGRLFNTHASAHSPCTTALPRLPPKLLILSIAEQQRRVLGLQRFCQQLLSMPHVLASSRCAQRPNSA